MNRVTSDEHRRATYRETYNLASEVNIRHDDDDSFLSTGQLLRGVPFRHKAVARGVAFVYPRNTTSLLASCENDPDIFLKR